MQDFSLRWENGLNVAIKNISIKNLDNTQKNNTTDIQPYIHQFFDLFPLLHSVSVEDIQFKEFHGTLQYTQNKVGFIKFENSSQKLYATFNILRPFILINLKEYKNNSQGILVNGSFIIDTQSLQLYSKLSANIKEYADLKIYLTANKTNLYYTLKSQKPISHINTLLSMLPMPKELDFWANHAIDAQSAHINALYGSLSFDDISSAYKNLYANITLKKLNYTYNPKLDAIHTETTELEFKKGTLYIYPKKAYSYGMYLDKSWLKIDLTPKKEYLSLFLDFNAKLNKDILHILQTYHITVPFLQKTGTTKTNLKIGVNLRTIAIDAHGKFYTDKALFEYLGLDIDVKNAFIELDNYDINIPKLTAKYKNIAQAFITAHYNAKKSLGDINFKVSKITLDKDIHLTLSNKKKLHITYKIAPSGDRVYVEESHWDIKGFPLTIDKSELALNLQKLQLVLSPTGYRVSDIANGYIEGNLDLKKMTLQATLDLLHFSYQGISTTQTDTEFQLLYDKKLSIKSFDDIYFSINGSQYKIKKLEAVLNEKEISLKHTMLYIGKYIHAKIYAKHKFNTKQAYVTLNKFTLKNPQTGHILYKNSKIPLLITFNDQNVQVDAKELRAHFFSTKKYWKLELDTLNVLSKKSNFLKKYSLNNGSVTFIKYNNDNIIKFKGKTKYKYKILTTRTEKIENYTINGYISKSLNVYVDINNKVNLKIANPMKLSVHDTGIDLEETLAFIESITAQKQEQNIALALFINAKNCYIKLDNERVVLSDSIKVQYFKDILTAQLLYKNGKAGFKLQNREFHLYGYGFNDTFMQNLFSISKFKGGNLDFSISGNLNKYNGIFFVKNTRMLDYVILNNVLAFINTVPSLATFSLPGYDKNGLLVNNAYMRFEAQNKHYTVSDLYIGSKEITIVGKGDVDLNTNSIDLTMNLKTDLGSNLSKVPLVGYILLDGKSISTTLKVYGPLKDPKVETMLAQDIAVAPLNIIMRTLKLPYKLINDSLESNQSTKNK